MRPRSLVRPRLLVFVLALLLVAGCAAAVSSVSQSEKPESLAPLPPPGMAGIYLIWTGGMFANDVQVQLDDEWQGLLEKDRYASGLVPPGAHTLGYKAGCQLASRAGQELFLPHERAILGWCGQVRSDFRGGGAGVCDQIEAMQQIVAAKCKSPQEDTSVLMKVELPASMYPLRRLEVLN